MLALTLNLCTMQVSGETEMLQCVDIAMKGCSQGYSHGDVRIKITICFQTSSIGIHMNGSDPNYPSNPWSSHFIQQRGIRVRVRVGVRVRVRVRVRIKLPQGASRCRYPDPETSEQGTVSQRSESPPETSESTDY